MDQYDMNQDGHIEFSDFVEYVLEQERKLRLNFHELDHNKDGKWSSQVTDMCWR